MQYIVHRRLKDTAICGGVNIPATTICEEICGVIFTTVFLFVIRQVKMLISFLRETMTSAVCVVAN